MKAANYRKPKRKPANYMKRKVKPSNHRYMCQEGEIVRLEIIILIIHINHITDGILRHVRVSKRSFLTRGRLNNEDSPKILRYEILTSAAINYNGLNVSENKTWYYHCNCLKFRLVRIFQL